MNQHLFRFIAASGLTNFADGIATVAWAWLASLLTRDPLLVATVAMALRLPWFLCAIPAGIVTDRVNRRTLIIWMDIIRAGAFLIAALSIWLALPLTEATNTGVSNLPLYLSILFAAFLVGTAEVFRDNAAQTMLPSIVSHDTLERANGRLWSVELVGNALLGPALGAFLLSFYLPLPFATNALAYLLAIALISRLSGQFTPEKADAPNWRKELREAYEFLRDAPLLKTLALITGFWNLLFQMMLIALILHVQENLGLSATAYGLILAAGAVGGILGGFVGDRIVRTIGPGRSAQLTLGASAVLFFGVGLAPNGVTLAIMLACFEFVGLVWNTVAVSYRQRTIPDRMLGRVNSLYRLLAWGMMPVGLLLSGLAVRTMGTVTDRGVALVSPFILAGAGGLLLTVFGWRALGRGFASQN